MSLRIRVDDFPYTKLHEWQPSRHSEVRFAEFDSIIPVRYLLGVIPMNCLNVGAWPPTGKAIPGMHGFWHLETRQNEFEGMGTNDITGYLQRGREMIAERCGRLPAVYMPPHNAMDLNTVRACEAVGFEAITGGPGTHPMMPRVIQGHTGMRYLHSQPPFFYGRSDEIMALVSSRASIPFVYEPGGILTLHWTWESNIGFDHLRRFIDQIRPYLEDFDAS